MKLFFVLSILASSTLFAQWNTTEMEISYYPSVVTGETMREEKVYSVVYGHRKEVIAEKTFVDSTNKLTLITLNKKSYVPTQPNFTQALTDVEATFKSVERTFKQVPAVGMNSKSLSPNGLENCTKDDSSDTISCPDGLYRKDGSTVDSLRQVVEKKQSSAKKNSQKVNSQVRQQ